MLHDTAGLNEADMGTVPAKDVLVNLRNLVHSLDDGSSIAFVDQELNRTRLRTTRCSTNCSVRRKCRW
jgi:hypothetical protein